MIAEVLGPVLGPVVRHPSGAAAKRRRTRCAGSKNPARELSRAQRGFYIFGNAAMVTRADKLWWDIGSVLNQLLAALEVMLRFLINSGWIGAVGWRFMDGSRIAIIRNDKLELEKLIALKPTQRWVTKVENLHRSTHPEQ